MLSRKFYGSAMHTDALLERSKLRRKIPEDTEGEEKTYTFVVRKLLRLTYELHPLLGAVQYPQLQAAATGRSRENEVPTRRCVLSATQKAANLPYMRFTVVGAVHYPQLQAAATGRSRAGEMKNAGY